MYDKKIFIIAKSNGDVRILAGSSEIAVFAHAQYKFVKNADKCSPIAEISFSEKIHLLNHQIT